ncbi:hypothetical protein ccbrp13_32910 [Ktedonobacteria bacterium brp13]|nr:hypothetical protein ccbrp13_32910 [Ktedonobacteria bacterium brp13]
MPSLHLLFSVYRPRFQNTQRVDEHTNRRFSRAIVVKDAARRFQSLQALK